MTLLVEKFVGGVAGYIDCTRLSKLLTFCTVFLTNKS